MHTIYTYIFKYFHVMLKKKKKNTTQTAYVS